MLTKVRCMHVMWRGWWQRYTQQSPYETTKKRRKRNVEDEGETRTKFTVEFWSLVLKSVDLIVAMGAECLENPKTVNKKDTHDDQ